ncbi:16S rRNA (cytosine(1402)-N(4))-methyltransferase RsmH [Borrelia hermsii]|uniref:Ribosomal RNA small subunit methyltransferase H n=3 Tax=Borrelia hermsii TaxID=140 RepID=RSMH_BORHD|nr:16S rRNA (cytosine(1402)-N(4))-methyltransferase RsmH [Borrelia hermsii]B2S017.1 RecName: Full=Ribosomal RNA small subunit methyltransferase H; AltName: Full=16S rRNA m(4)C1402 methyltransferase; AltName: Full=rRNA (cytosine-N(4)-)-methyltransferase RsmH [Borrelia hermsii DAH]AAX16823.1 S-adenosyl-methyltransferase MraW [Borrelia hermsii DAH]AJW73122.1 16S rRNA methyltransferase [Borrelia hermsii CC1]AMR75525.1 16S rRNA (cytosine(1402)-N(4))-methyltransferase [Borrelia hermsii]ANA43122.1 ri
MGNIFHTPVLLDEIINLLEIVYVNDGFIFVDCTLGEGGHSSAVLRKYQNISVIGIERDDIILNRAKEFLVEFKGKVSYFNAWFDDFFSEYSLSSKANFILADLGISMFHYKMSGRGFSFFEDERLDMRLNPGAGGLSAYDIVNTFDKVRLENLIYEFGGEHYSKRIVSSILEYRKIKKIKTSRELQGIISKAYPRIKLKINPATKTFQALRIYVNDELFRLKRSLPLWVGSLSRNGILAIITFHSLEDKIVKEFFKGLSKEQYCILTKKPIIASFEEKRCNNASRSAKLRAIRKLYE